MIIHGLRRRLLLASALVVLGTLARYAGPMPGPHAVLAWLGDLRALVVGLTHEAALLATCLVVFIAIDDLLVDLLWMAGTGRRSDRRSSPDPNSDGIAGPIAILIPVWDEAAVIEAMLAHNAAALAGQDCDLVVGCYRNDTATIAAVERAAIKALAAGDARIVRLDNGRDGPTTKGDNLNGMAAALARREACIGRRYVGVIGHDAEDCIDPSAPALFRRWWTVADFVQIPVVPLPDQTSRWIAAHYIDEFADAHRRQMPIRCALGAGVPAAGVGCGWSRGAFDRIAGDGGEPFRAASLTEDYEAGLASGWSGLRCRFVSEQDASGRLIATRAHFPADWSSAVTQKSRWIAGIAFSGWDRLGWGARRRTIGGGRSSRRETAASAWMLWRDRRATIASLAVAAALVALATWLLGLILSGFTRPVPLPPDGHVLALGVVITAWRGGWRMASTASIHGWRIAMLAIPRMVTGNLILVAATARAAKLDARSRRDGVIRWEKTAHRFDPPPLTHA